LAAQSIAETLTESSLPLSVLQEQIEQILRRAQEEDRLKDLLEMDGISFGTSEQLRANAREYRQFVSAFVQLFEDLPVNYKVAIEVYCTRFGADIPDFVRFLQGTIGAVEKNRDELLPKRSGGAEAERDDMLIKKRCARLAHYLIIKFHPQTTLSPSCKPYLDVTAILYQHWTGDKRPNVRRACKKYFEEHCMYKQDST
jgi:hypothetical protein